MPIDIGREIAHYRNWPGHNWLSEALRKLQDHTNTLAPQKMVTDLQNQLTAALARIAALEKK